MGGKRGMNRQGGRVLLLLLGVLLAGGCHTVGGFGKDLQVWSGTDEKPKNSPPASASEPKNPYR